MRSRSLHALHLVSAASAAMALGVLLNCGEVAPNLENGARCSLNSDCKSPLVCGFERCRAQCKTSRDCGGKLCVRGQDGANVCQLDDEVECTHNSQCPGSQLCGPDRHCRDVCITDKDCVTDLLCVSRVCAKPEELVNGALPQKSPADASASCTYATDCPGDLVCLYGRCDVECLGDKDCLVGWSCRPTARAGDGRCYPNAVSGDAGADATSDASDASFDASTPPADASDGSADANDGSDGSAPLPPESALSIAVGFYYHTCAILVGNKVKCWGYNNFGQLGLGDTQTRGDGPGEMGDNLPYVDLGTGRTAKALTAGGYHSCAILDNDKVKCWGTNNFGQLGIGDTQARGDGPNEMGDNLPFVDLGAGRTAKFIASHGDHTCAILDNDKIKCWGYNSFGQLGIGDNQARGDGPNEMGDNLPYVDLGAGRSPKALAVGFGHTCALLDDDKVKCWGYNPQGQLGIGNTQNRGDQPGEMGDNLPYVDLGTGRTTKLLGGGAVHTCAILDNDKVKCWGRNDYGHLGIGDNQARGDAQGEMGDNLPYVELGTGRSAKTLRPGGEETCAILDNDKVKCWGRNVNGKLGIGDTVGRGDGPGQMGDNLPYVELGTGRSPKTLSQGGTHTCVVLDNLRIKCWGTNLVGNLGLGDTQNRGDTPGEMGDALPYVKLVGP